MRNLLRWVGFPILMLTAAILIAAGTFQAGAQPKKGGAKAVDKVLHDSLRTVINAGAALFNKNGDANGCYQLYHGSLLTVRPLLAHRPDLQKAITDGLKSAESEANLRGRAFALNKVLQSVRSGLKAERLPLPGKDKKVKPKKKAPPKKKTDSKKKKADPKKKKADPKKKKADPKKKSAVKKKPDPKKVDPKKLPKPKKVDPKKGASVKTGQINGKVTINGKPLANATITFDGVSDVKAKLAADGSYTVKSGLPVGRYVVFIEPAAGAKAAVPRRYTNPATSGLTIEVTVGKNLYNVFLN